MKFLILPIAFLLLISCSESSSQPKTNSNSDVQVIELSDENVKPFIDYSPDPMCEGKPNGNYDQVILGSSVDGVYFIISFKADHTVKIQGDRVGVNLSNWSFEGGRLVGDFGTAERTEDETPTLMVTFSESQYISSFLRGQTARLRLNYMTHYCR